METTAYPGIAHLWAVGWTAIGSVVWWPVYAAQTDALDTYWGPLRLILLPVLSAMTALVAQSAVPVAATWPALRRHPSLVGLVAAGAAAAIVIGYYGRHWL